MQVILLLWQGMLGYFSIAVVKKKKTSASWIKKTTVESQSLSSLVNGIMVIILGYKNSALPTSALPSRWT